jgi:D-alanyl-D-alanine carboxypeptidase (penicillin-binding protein 5/6)
MTFDQTLRRTTALLFLSLLLPLAQIASAQRAAMPVPAPPRVDARSYLLMDFHSGRILAELDADTPAEPASLTKLMTTYIVFGELDAGRLSLDDEVLVSERAWKMGGSQMFIEVGMRVTVGQLLRGVIVQSGNDASVALAERIAGTEENFALMMNDQAMRLGLENSHFRNATGLQEDGHLVTARDVAKLSRALIARFPTLYDLFAERSFEFNDIAQRNRNPLLDTFDGADGLKTGYTKAAGYCLAASAERDGMRLISVVLGADSPRGRADATRAMMNYGFHFYATHRLYQARQPVTSTRVWKGAEEEVMLGLHEPLYVTIPRGSYERLEASTEVLERAVAPVSAATHFGELLVALDGEAIAEAPLYSLAPVEAAGFARRTWDQIMLWFE